MNDFHIWKGLPEVIIHAGGDFQYRLFTQLHNKKIEKCMPCTNSEILGQHWLHFTNVISRYM